MLPTPIFLPGKLHVQWSLAGYSSWSHKESDVTEHTHTRKHKNIKSGNSIFDCTTQMKDALRKEGHGEGA